MVENPPGPAASVVDVLRSAVQQAGWTVELLGNSCYCYSMQHHENNQSTSPCNPVYSVVIGQSLSFSTLDALVLQIVLANAAVTK